MWNYGSLCQNNEFANIGKGDEVHERKTIRRSRNENPESQRA